MLRKLFSELTTVSLSVFTAITSIGGAFTYLFGAWNKTFQVMLMVIFIDIVTGVIVAIKGKSSKSENGKLSSKAGERGLLKKIGLIAVVAFANIVGMLFPTEVRTALREGVVIAVIWNEAVSVLENFTILEWWVPDVLKQFVLSNKKKSDEQSLTETPHEEPTNEKEESEEVGE